MSLEDVQRSHGTDGEWRVADCSKHVLQQLQMYM